MKCNVGKTDSIFRIVVGVVIIAVGVFMGSWLGAIGLVVLLTGIFRRCLFYVPFGISTDKQSE